MGVLNFFRRLTSFREIAKTPKRDLAWGMMRQHRAFEQGWGIFEVDRPGGRTVELQRVDGKGVFRRDSDAWVFVYMQMQAGDPLAVQAFDYLEQHGPGEYEAIFHFCRIAA